MPELIGRRVATVDDLERAGDYTDPGPIKYPGDEMRQQIWFLLPIHEGEDKFDRPTVGSGLHGISSPPWTFTECPDGSIAVGGSIACGRGAKEGEYFHGWLEEGHRWRW